ncbi:MAG: DinB family protein [Chloroflexota bacterium]
MSDTLSIDSLARLLEASAIAIAGEAFALGNLARVRPAPEDWCANEVIGHLIEAERRGFNGRIRLILSAAPGTEPFLPAWDQPGVAAARKDGEKATADLLHELAELRADSIDLLHGLRPDDLGRRGSHPKVGPLRVDELAQEWIHHDREHLKQLLDVTRAFAWNGMGAAKKFTDPTA